MNISYKNKYCKSIIGCFRFYLDIRSGHIGIRDMDESAAVHVHGADVCLLRCCPVHSYGDRDRDHHHRLLRVSLHDEGTQLLALLGESLFLF